VPPDVAFRGEAGVLSQPINAGWVVRDELEGQVEAARADELDQRLGTRGHHALLPACDHAALATGPLGELVLGEAGAQARFADDVGASLMAGKQPDRELVMCHTSPGIALYTLEAGGLYEADHPAVAVYPRHFLPWPCTVDEIADARQWTIDDAQAATANRERMWAEAEQRDREALTKAAAAEAEAEHNERSRIAAWWNRQEA
jgi:hypothetical protein